MDQESGLTSQTHKLWDGTLGSQAHPQFHYQILPQSVPIQNFISRGGTFTHTGYLGQSLFLTLIIYCLNKDMKLVYKPIGVIHVSTGSCKCFYDLFAYFSIYLPVTVQGCIRQSLVTFEHQAFLSDFSCQIQVLRAPTSK